MGSFGQVLGTLAGGFIGFIVGGPFGAAFSGMMLGASLGGTIGAWLDPIDSPQAPPLGDLGINSYVHNAPVPIAYGQVKAYGGVIWTGEKKIWTSGGGKGKGGSGSETHMHLEYAVAHCAGPIESYIQYYVDDKRLEDITSVLLNEIFSSVFGKDADVGTEYNFTSYLGTGVQPVDPIIQEYQGTGDRQSPPYLYTAYTVVDATNNGQVWQTYPTIAAEIRSLLTEPGEQDANPIKVLYDFLTNTTYGVGYSSDEFNGDPYTVDSPWKVASDYCDTAFTYYDVETATYLTVPKYRYSNFISEKLRGYDLVLDILFSCRGVLRRVNGLWEPIIHTGADTPSLYFSDYLEFTISVGSGSTVDRIYADFSSYEDNYFLGSFGLYDGEEFEICSQTSTYIDLCSSMSTIINSGENIVLKKDNIKENTFSYSRTAEQEVLNKVRVEFINREAKDKEGEIHNDYIWDNYDLDSEDIYTTVSESGYVEAGEAKTKSIRSSGVKRKCQAMSLAQYFLSFSKHNRFYCEFSTDISASFLSIGDVVAVYHSVSGWDNKYFYVVGIEETEQDEISLKLLEYNSYVITNSFNIPAVTTTTNEANETFYQEPDPPILVDASSLWVYNSFVVHWEPPVDDSVFFSVYVFVDTIGDGSYEHWYTTSESTKYFSQETFNPSVPVIDMVSAAAEGFPTSGHCIINDMVFLYDASGNLTSPTLDGSDLFSVSNIPTAPFTVYYYNPNSTKNSGYLGPDSLSKIYSIKLVSKSVVGVFSDYTATSVDKTVVNMADINYQLNDPKLYV